MRLLLNIPNESVPVVYLCLGYVAQFFVEPKLQSAGWLPRLPLDGLIYFDQWQEQRVDDPFAEQIRQDSSFPESFVDSK